MMHKVEIQLEFSKKRNYKLITPCCQKSNKDGKFVNYKSLPEIYGYCHSCGKATIPPQIYLDDNGVEYIWNEVTNCFEKLYFELYDKSNFKLYDKNVLRCTTSAKKPKNKLKYIQNDLLYRYNVVFPESNLMSYIRKTYGNEKAEKVKNDYFIGTTKDGGTIFWYINEKQQVQKAKVSYYNNEGKRTNKFKVPYKNENGYQYCLYGEHLISKYPEKKIIIVESEKTAIISSILFPQYSWLSYGGKNGLTEAKLNVLRGHKILIVPDMSQDAVLIIKEKLSHLQEIGIDAEIWDMTEGKSDEQLRVEGWYNCDLEDIFRTFL